MPRSSILLLYSLIEQIEVKQYSSMKRIDDKSRRILYDRLGALIISGFTIWCFFAVSGASGMSSGDVFQEAFQKPTPSICFEVYNII